MQPIFNPHQLIDTAKQHHNEYTKATPFPHVILDNFMSPDILSKAAQVFPQTNELEFYQYNNPLERKLAYDRISELPKPIYEILVALNAPTFLCFLEELTGLQGLIADPYYRGGGIHQIEPGGKLDVHIDFNYYQKLGLIRCLNVLIYLNEDWKENYGGCLELWTGQKIDGQHVLHSCKKEILPIFNRMVVFTTSEHSYHGHPKPLTCPSDRTRQSIATYYYLSPANIKQETDWHSTTFIKRPQDPHDPSLDALRHKRNKGRIQSNVKSDLVAD